MDPQAGPPSSELGPTALLARAAEYQRLAAAAATLNIRDALLQMAERLERLARGCPCNDNERT
jgi:hypothetical protein